MIVLFKGRCTVVGARVSERKALLEKRGSLKKLVDLGYDKSKSMGRDVEEKLTHRNVKILGV